MKKLPILAILAVVGFAMVGCGRYDQNPLVDEVKRFYEGSHQLRKMFVKDEEVTVKEPGRGHLSGAFFLFIGGISGNFKEGTETKNVVTHVRFAWEIEDNAYVITTLPLEKVRIKLAEKVEAPTVSFFLNAFDVNRRFEELRYRAWYGLAKKSVEDNLGRILRNYYDPHEALARYLGYAVFTVRSEDWPASINLPVSQSYSK